MTKLFLILVAFFLAAVNASCFWKFLFNFGRAPNLEANGIMKESSLRKSPASEALLKSLNKDGFGAKQFSEFFYSKKIGSIKIFDDINSLSQDAMIIFAFEVFVCDNGNSEAAKSLVNNYILPAYPILEGFNFNFEAFRSYLNPFECKNLTSFLDEIVFKVFKERLNGILTATNESSIPTELNGLFSKAHNSIYSTNNIVAHSFHVASVAHADLIRKADAACSKATSNLENYMVCAVTLLQEQMFAYLNDKQLGYNESMNLLTRAFFAFAAKYGLKEIVNAFLSLRSSAAAAKGLSDPDFIKVPFRFACNNEQLSIMELIIDAEPSIRINSDLKCNALSLATRKRNDKLFYHLLGPSGNTNKIRQISSDIVDSIEFAIKDNNLDYCNAILNKCNMIIPNDLAKWMADAMGSRNHPLEEVLMNNSSRLLREFDFEQFKEAVQSRNSENVRTLWN